MKKEKGIEDIINSLDLNNNKLQIGVCRKFNGNFAQNW